MFTFAWAWITLLRGFYNSESGYWMFVWITYTTYTYNYLYTNRHLWLNYIAIMVTLSLLACLDNYGEISPSHWSTRFWQHLLFSCYTVFLILLLIPLKQTPCGCSPTCGKSKSFSGCNFILHKNWCRIPCEELNECLVDTI